MVVELQKKLEGNEEDLEKLIDRVEPLRGGFHLDHAEGAQMLLRHFLISTKALHPCKETVDLECCFYKYEMIIDL